MFSLSEKEKQTGFTLIELLIVVAIMALLVTLILVGIGGAQAKARDRLRIQSMRSLHNGLELYYQDNSKYVTAGSGTNMHGFKYQFINPATGQCSGVNIGAGVLNFDNSASGEGIIENLPSSYISTRLKDPKGLNNINSRYSCRYITEIGSPLQRYFLHCTIERSPELAQNDGGSNSDLYEIFEPSKWLCVSQIPAS